MRARARPGRFLRRGLHGGRRADRHRAAGGGAPRRAAARVEVINGGTAAYSTDQEYLFYRDEGRRYAPDVVVALRLPQRHPLPRPRRLPRRPQAASRFLGPASVAGDGAGAALPAAARDAGARRRPAGAPTSYLLEFVKDRLERTSASTYNRLARRGLWEPLRKLPMNDELRLFHVPELGHLRPAWSAFTWTLQTLSRAVAAAGGRLVDRLRAEPHGGQPEHVGAHPGPLRPGRGVRPLRGGQPDPLHRGTAVAAHARPHGAAGRRGSACCGRSTFRPTATGTRAARRSPGQALAEFLAERGLVPGCR